MVSPPDEMNPASPLMMCSWLSVIRSTTTTLESSAESRGTSTEASRTMSIWASCCARLLERAGVVPVARLNGSWRTISRWGIVSLPVTAMRRILRPVAGVRLHRDRGAVGGAVHPRDASRAVANG